MKRFLGIALALILIVSCMPSLGLFSAASAISNVAVAFDRDNEIVHGADPFTDITFIPDDLDVALATAFNSFGFVNGIYALDVGYGDLSAGDTLIIGHTYIIGVALTPEGDDVFSSQPSGVLYDDYRDYPLSENVSFISSPYRESDDICLVFGEVVCQPAVIEDLSFIVGSPAAGMPAYCSTVTVGGPASVADLNYAPLYSGVSWYDNTAGRRLTASDTIVQGHAYEVTVLLEADVGHAFSPNCSFKCNGSYVERDETDYYADRDPERYVEITVDAGTAQTVMINDVYVYVEPPYVGGDPYDLDYGTGNAEGYNIVTEDVLWYKGPDPLYGGYNYVWNDVPIIEMPLRAESGYVFFHDRYGGKPNVYLNGEPLDPSDVMLESGNQRLVITHGFGQPESDVIDAVDVLITPPYYGSCANMLDVCLPNNSNCYIDRTDMIWYNGDTPVDEDFPFSPGDDPYVIFTIKKGVYSTFPHDDEWNALTTLTVNGKTPEYVGFDENGDLLVCFDFGEVLDVQTIVCVDLYVDEPCVDVDPYTQTATVGEDAHCSFSVFSDGNVLVWNNGSENVEPGCVFTANDNPSFTCFLVPDDGYVFLSGTDGNGNYLICVTVNGERVAPAYVGDGVVHRMMTIDHEMRLNEEPVEITDVYVYLEEPYEGCDPYELNVYYSESGHFSVRSKINWGGNDEYVDWNGVLWCDGARDDDDKILSPGQYYNYGAQPFVKVDLGSNNGYVFSQNVNVYVNNHAVNDSDVYLYTFHILHDRIYFTYNFDPITSNDTAINTIDVLTNPSTVSVGEDPYAKTNTVFGEEPGPNGRPFNHYSLWAEPAIWYRSSVEQEMLAGETYEYGDLPIVDFFLRAHSGYRFNMSRNEDGSYQLTVRVNGQTAQIVDFIATDGKNVVIRCVFDRLAMPCDINCDGEVNVADVSALLDYIANKAADDYDVACDLNNDGEVNVADVSALLDFIANN